MTGFRGLDLWGFLHFAGSQAPGADANALNGAILHDAHALKIGIELPRTHIVRVRNRAPEGRRLGANITLHRHDNLLSKGGDNIRQGARSQGCSTVWSNSGMIIAAALERTQKA